MIVSNLSGRKNSGTLIAVQPPYTTPSPKEPPKPPYKGFLSVPCPALARLADRIFRYFVTQSPYLYRASLLGYPHPVTLPAVRFYSDCRTRRGGIPDSETPAITVDLVKNHRLWERGRLSAAGALPARTPARIRQFAAPPRPPKAAKFVGSPDRILTRVLLRRPPHKAWVWRGESSPIQAS
jgi:hypothetical protein